MTPTRAPSAPGSAPATLSDLEPLLPAEAIVLRAAASGDIAKVSYRRPRPDATDVKVRAEFLAFLAAGGGSGAPVAGRRLQVMGAAVVGRFALSGATLPLSLWLFRCTFDTAPVFDGAHVMGHLSFGDCALPGLRAEDCRIDGDLALNAGCSVDGEVELGRASIGRELDCERLHLGGPDDAARTWRRRFVADAIRVGGNVNLRGGAETVGEVRFVGARIGGDLLASGARLTADLDEAGARGVALTLDRAEIGGNVALDAGFSAGGAVRLKQARIGGDLICTGADFDAVGDASWGENAAALLLERARIGGTLDLRRLPTPLRGASLEDAQVATLLDDATTWGEHHVLDGFAYRRFGAGAPTDATMRLDWLLRQRADQVDGNFRDDPWRRVIAALHDSGRSDSARVVAIGRERHLRRIGAIGRVPARIAHAAYGALAGYGYRPLRVLGGAVLVWLACGAVYWSQAGGFAPSAALLAAAPKLAACRPECALLPATMSAFQPLVYSLDVLVPLVDLQQRRHWAPALETQLGVPPLRVLAWLEAACGWLLALTGLVAVSGVTERDRRR